MYRELISTWNQIDMHSSSSDRGPPPGDNALSVRLGESGTRYRTLS